VADLRSINATAGLKNKERHVTIWLTWRFLLAKGFFTQFAENTPSVHAGFQGIPLYPRIDIGCWQHHPAEVHLMRGLQCHVGHAKIRALSE
jgi:hypothetical protein